MIVVWIVVIIVVLLALYVAFRFNAMVRLRTRTQEAWSDIDVELKRRHDLIPNLVSTVQGYAAHERTVFEEVTQARTNAVSAAQTGSPAVMAGAEDALTTSLGRLMAVAENYPQLQAVQVFLNLQEQLTTTEDKVEFSRRYYNANVRDFNSALQRFPTNLIASGLGFTPFQFFQAADSERAAPQVQFATPPAAPPAAS
ncbi:MAG: LemA family protein [Candidatus Dormibacteraeota bacterium]|nr:LemA family protein [Candidatus Dormibacteraeota bacterium]